MFDIMKKPTLPPKIKNNQFKLKQMILRKKIIKAFLVLSIAVTMTLGVSGCGSSLSNSEVCDKVEELASQSGKNIKCKAVVDYFPYIACLSVVVVDFIVSIIGDKDSNPGLRRCFTDIVKSDEVWIVKCIQFHEEKDFILFRRGKLFFLADIKTYDIKIRDN